MKLKAFQIDSEDFWDYFFSLPKNEKEIILSELNGYLDDSQTNIYVEKELLESK